MHPLKGYRYIATTAMDFTGLETQMSDIIVPLLHLILYDKQVMNVFLQRVTQ